MATTNRLKLRIAGSNPLGGRQPGQTFTVPADADGVPLDRFWRDRLDETNRRLAAGREPAVVVVTPEPVPAPESAPASLPSGVPPSLSSPPPSTAPKARDKAKG